MAFRYFPGTDLEWLKTKLSTINEELAAGKSSISFGAADTSGSFQVEQRLQETKRQLCHDIYTLTGDQEYADARGTKITKGIFADRYS